MNSKVIILVAALAIGVGLYGLMKPAPEAAPQPNIEAPAPEPEIRFSVYTGFVA